MTKTYLVELALLIALAMPSALANDNPDLAAVERGRKGFVASCGFCHGNDATGNRQEVFGHRAALALPVSAERAIYCDGEDKIGRAIRGETAAYRRIRFRDDGPGGLASLMGSQ